MDSQIAIKVEHLSKAYALRNAQVDEAGNTVYEHLALNNISFEIIKGESVGIIGPNGSGKSTLLKILAGVTKPTSGKVTITGKVASILDIGAGFHPELSGRENIYLNGQIHGFSKQEIERKYDEIVEFSGIEKFVEEPVKNYSSGMYLRLAFSIMANLDFDVYLFDEVFSVGDAEFSMKTKKKLQELSQTDKTVVFVSHNVGELQGQDSYVLLEYGNVKGKTKDKNLLSDYIENVMQSDGIKIHTKAVEVTDFSSFTQSSDIKVLNIKFYQQGQEIEEFRIDKLFVLELEYEKMKDTDTIDVLLDVLDIEGRAVLSSAPYLRSDFSKETKIGSYRYVCKIFANVFNSQVYHISISFVKNLNEMLYDENNKHFLLKNIKPHTLTNVLSFKPLFVKKGRMFDLYKTNKGVILDFEWTLSIQ